MPSLNVVVVAGRQGLPATTSVVEYLVVYLTPNVFGGLVRQTALKLHQQIALPRLAKCFAHHLALQHHVVLVNHSVTYLWNIVIT